MCVLGWAGLVACLSCLWRRPRLSEAELERRDAPERTCAVESSRRRHADRRAELECGVMRHLRKVPPWLAVEVGSNGWAVVGSGPRQPDGVRADASATAAKDAWACFSFGVQPSCFFVKPQRVDGPLDLSGGGESKSERTGRYLGRSRRVWNRIRKSTTFHQELPADAIRIQRNCRGGDASNQGPKRSSISRRFGGLGSLASPGHRGSKPQLSRGWLLARTATGSVDEARGQFGRFLLASNFFSFNL
ncbi:hypothetical protein GQ53DRAFT_338526 [Thozetella sp. PMI_491]|nr:hypothetical protein GQ53DRAFT_338526 [Thozetella sp. PMI_491]